MDKIFYPASIVVAGVSEKADNLGRNIAENIIRYQYKGDLYLLGRSRGELQGLPIVNSAADLPLNIDLAVILTPAQTVLPLLEEFGQRGIRHIIIETSGFSEFSAEGGHLEEEIASIAKKWGMRLVGPNCIGVICLESGINSLFVRMEKEEMKAGRISVISQSGGVILSITDFLTASGLGVSKTVSVGNKLDLKEADYLEYFLSDKATDIILLYLESVVEGRKLAELADQGVKPVIVYKSNNNPASAEMAKSHTAALSNDDDLVSAAFRQFGLTRVPTFRDMVNTAKGFSLPPVRNNRLAVFSRSGGLAIITADTANEFGFDLPAFPEELLEKAMPFFRADVISLQNPLDMGTVFDFDSFPIIIEETIKLTQPGALLMIFNYRRETRAKAREIAEQLKKLSQRFQTAIAICYFTEMDEIHQLERDLDYPLFNEVYDAIQALAASRDFTQKKALRSSYSKDGGLPGVSPDTLEKALGILQNASSGELQIDQALQLCEAFGLPTAPWGIASDGLEAAGIAAQIGYPVVIKVAGSGALHKSDVGGVALNLNSSKEIAGAMERIQESLHKHGLSSETRFLVQKMVSGGREVIMGGRQDPAFGATVLCGLGGIYAEVFRDVSLRLAPLYPQEALEMLAELRGVKYLSGARGEKSVDMNALAEILTRVSQLLRQLPQIAELDLNPVLAFETGALLVDARVILK